MTGRNVTGGLVRSKRPDEASDVGALRDLAQGWRDVSYRCRYEKDRALRDDDPGPHMTAIQLEWAAAKIEELRRELYARNVETRP